MGNGAPCSTTGSTVTRWRSARSTGLSLLRDSRSVGYGIEKTHADGRFELAGVSREVVEEFSTRRAEIEAVLMTRAKKRDVDKGELRLS